MCLSPNVDAGIRKPACCECRCQILAGFAELFVNRVNSETNKNKPVAFTQASLDSWAEVLKAPSFFPEEFLFYL
jgi:hypothetical protein